MEKIINRKDLINMNFIKDSEGRLVEYKPLRKFIPKSNEYYYFIGDCGYAKSDKWYNTVIDKWRLKHYKLFRTEEECEDYKGFLEMVNKYSYKFSIEEWKNEGIDKYSIEYDFESYSLNFPVWFHMKNTNNVYFKSSQDRTDFINEVGEERIKKYMFDIWEF